MAFQDVAFRYAGAGHAAIDDLTLTVPAGTTTAIVGETGWGKTTLGYLVAHLYDPDSGRVTIDGHDVRDLGFASLADAVGVVSQETYLVHATVRENIRFARPEATDEEVEVAAEAARIHHVIAALPEGNDTVVGERGYRFSGCEKQRIAIAHRLSTVRDAEQIVALDRGRIVERGNHDQLAARGGHHAAMLTGAGELQPA